MVKLNQESRHEVATLDSSGLKRLYGPVRVGLSGGKHKHATYTTHAAVPHVDYFLLLNLSAALVDAAYTIGGK